MNGVLTLDDRRVVQLAIASATRKPPPIPAPPRAPTRGLRAVPHRVFRCVYCGTPAVDRVCHAHAGLVELDANFGAVL